MGDQVISLKASPSLQYQNLSYGDDKFVYVHKNEAHILNAAKKETSSIQTKEKVYQAKICQIDGRKLLVLAVQGGTQFWDLTREKCLFTVSHSEEGSFVSRGIASSGKNVFTGSSTGTILVIEVKADGASVIKTLKEHRDSITDIASGSLNGSDVVISSDLAGEVIIWDSAGTLMSKLDQSPGDAVSCVSVTPKLVACGYGSGKLRLFAPSGKKAVEIAAHSRWINAIDYCEKKNLLASVSEDMVVQFWQLPTTSDGKVSLKGSKLLKDCLLTGVKFTDDGAKVGCAAYDTEKFHLVDC